jgi:hypothetical protein
VFVFTKIIFENQKGNYSPAYPIRGIAEEAQRRIVNYEGEPGAVTGREADRESQAPVTD